MSTEERIKKMLIKCEPILKADKPVKKKHIEKICGNCECYSHSLKSCWIFPFIDNLDRFTCGCKKFSANKSNTR